MFGFKIGGSKSWILQNWGTTNAITPMIFFTKLPWGGVVRREDIVNSFHKINFPKESYFFPKK
jgi:hypothetical protein